MLKLPHKVTKSLFRLSTSHLSYVQGQEPIPGKREYFYYIDHQGQLFLDDAKVKNFITCFKEKEFLNFFFRRMKKNKTGRYEQEFPFLSLCGRERNFIRCDDVPIVYNAVINKEDKYFVTYGGTNTLIDPFEPEKICMLNSGRVYHPASERVGGLGLIKSSLAIDISQYFTYENSDLPTHFTWNNKKYTLTHELFYKYNLSDKE